MTAAWTERCDERLLLDELQRPISARIVVGDTRRGVAMKGNDTDKIYQLAVAHTVINIHWLTCDITTTSVDLSKINLHGPFCCFKDDEGNLYRRLFVACGLRVSSLTVVDRRPLLY